jgi:hypothetical protein
MPSRAPLAPETGDGRGSPPEPRHSRRAFLSTLAAGLPLLGAGCASPSTTASGLHWTAPQHVETAARLTSVLIRDFEDRVTAKYDSSPIDRRVAKKQQMQRAVVEVPGLLARHLTATGRFASILREGNPDTSTLVLRGVLVRYHEEDGNTRRFTTNNAGYAQFEVHLELREGATDTLLATLIAENSPAGIGRGVHPAESLATATDRVCADIARTLSR